MAGPTKYPNVPLTVPIFWKATPRTFRQYVMKQEKAEFVKASTAVLTAMLTLLPNDQVKCGISQNDALLL